MKANNLSLALAILALVFTFLPGCEEQSANSTDNSLSIHNFYRTVEKTDQAAEKPEKIQTTEKNVATTKTTTRQTAPKLTFEKLVYNFGDVNPNSKQICVFNFKNTGSDVLKIIDVNSSCGCTITKLLKNEYAPGESGSLGVGYTVESYLGEPTKPIYVFSNDPTNPKIELNIKAKITAAIDYEPRVLTLSLKQPNGGCPDLTVTSLDKQPFAITSFKSTSNCITAEFDSAKDTKHVLKLKVNLDTLESIEDGTFEIEFDHPLCNKIGGTFKAPARFTATPKSITILQAKPETITKKVTVSSSYGENFEIVSAVSRENIITVSNKTKTSRGYDLELNITPPSNNKTKSFTDVLVLTLSGGKTFDIHCNGVMAPTTAAQDAKQADSEKECKTCKPLVIDSTGVGIKK
jgi:hypothetical protein